MEVCKGKVKEGKKTLHKMQNLSKKINGKENFFHLMSFLILDQFSMQTETGSPPDFKSKWVGEPDYANPAHQPYRRVLRKFCKSTLQCESSTECQDKGQSEDF